MNIDISKITPKEAGQNMLHHLRLAAAFFEAGGDEIAIPKKEFSGKAMSCWAVVMKGIYDGLDNG